MDTLSLDVDKELAEEYCEKLRELFPTQFVDLNNNALMVVFVEEHLAEELKFVEYELSLNG